jgi:hypothetical protein
VAEEQQNEAELPPPKIAETERIIARLEQVVREAMYADLATLQGK